MLKINAVYVVKDQPHVHENASSQVIKDQCFGLLLNLVEPKVLADRLEKRQEVLMNESTESLEMINSMVPVQVLDFCYFGKSGEEVVETHVCLVLVDGTEDDVKLLLS
jgi:hypothetical protein